MSNGIASEVVGREGEVAVLGDFLDGLSAGPGACTVEGDPGIGKTAIWRTGITLAAERGYRILSSRPVETEAKLSFAALGDLLDDVGQEELSSLPDVQRTAMEVALLRARPTKSSIEPRSVGLALLGVLRAMAEVQPVVVAVDDVQWLDPPTHRVLSFALRRLSKECVGVLTTFRAGSDAELSLEVSDDAGHPRGTEIRLGPLSLGAISLMLGHRGPALPRSAMVDIHRASGGNPLLALTMAESVLTSGTLSRLGHPLPVPEALRKLLADRVHGLSPGTTEVLELASALNSPTEEILARAGTVGVAEALEEARQQAVIEEGDPIRFSHPMLASVVYWTASKAGRSQVHLRLAGAVGDPEERARHLALGSDPPNAVVAGALEAGAAEAGARGAPDVAGELLQEAAHFTPNDASEARLERQRRAAEHHFTAGDTTRAGYLLEEVVEKSPPGVARAQALFQLARIRFIAHTFPAADQLYAQALAEVGDHVGLRARIERAVAFTAVVQGDMQRAAAHAAVALELADHIGDRRLRASSLAAKAVADFLLGQGVDVTALDEATAVEEEAGVPIDWTPAFSYAWLKLYSDDVDGARVLFQAEHTRAVDRGDEASLPGLLLHLSLLECWAGHWELAGGYADQAIESSTRAELTFVQVWALYARALVDAHLGRDARPRAEEALALAQQVGAAIPMSLCLSVLGFIALSRGDYAEADARLRPLADMVQMMGVAEPGAIRFLPDEIEALVALGETERAEALLSQFEARAAALGRVWALATGGRCRGLLAASKGHTDGALAAFDAALGWHEQLPMPFELARTLLAKGQVERRAKKWGPARADVGRALEVFEDLGAAQWADRARRELGRIGGRRPSPSELSETERLIAERIAAGATTREVADALFISPKTVQNSLGRVYAKLGIKSRTELAARLGRDA